MKVRASVKVKCDSCNIVSRNGIRVVMCSNPAHRFRSGGVRGRSQKKNSVVEGLILLHNEGPRRNGSSRSLSTQIEYFDFRSNPDIEMLKYFLNNFSHFSRISGHDFERLIGEIYRLLGYDIEYTKSTRDGGYDFAIYKDSLELGKQLYIVECKNWSAKKVGVQETRKLLGAVDQHKANQGLIWTPNTFTKEAKICALDSNNKISLRDKVALKKLIRKVIKKK